MRRAALVALTLAVFILSSSYASTTSPRVPAIGDTLPDVMLWAWERPTDLRDLDERTGVAFLAQTIVVAARVTVTPRRNPLRVSAHTPLVAVTRIESPHADTTRLDAAELDDLAARIVATAALPRVVAIQIDFDAANSERAFYRRLLTRLRETLPAAVPLSMTALASWCVGDDWLAGLAIDEAVPMLFRMGPINEPYASIGLRASDAVRVCRTAVGTSLDEPLAIRRSGRRVYVFSSDAWTPQSIARARERAR
jgi:hypothetical protein